MARLTDLDAQVIGISVNDPFSNKGFSEKNFLPYPILSDYNREVIKRYGLELGGFRWVERLYSCKTLHFSSRGRNRMSYMWVV